MSMSPLLGPEDALGDGPPLHPSDSSLVLAPTLSLSIGSKALHVHDDGDSANGPLSRMCLGIQPGLSGSRSTSIPLYNILWAEVDNQTIIIRHAKRSVAASLSPESLAYPFELPSRSQVDRWTDLLLQAAYENSQPRKRFKVLINPFGGQGNAKRLFEKRARPVLEAANCVLDVQATEYHGHGVDIARELDIAAHDAVICCSGDGVPSEVFNGLAKRPDALEALSRIAVCQLPCGSGNAMCWNLTGTDDVAAASLAIVKAMRKPLDLVSITQGDRRSLSFLSQSVGIIAEVDLGTEDLRWMGGFRFTVGLLQRLWKQAVYPCELAVKVALDDKEAIRDHYRHGRLRHRGDDTDKPAQHTGDGLPPLRFGTINSPLPKDWELVPHPNMGNFYAGNMAWVSAGADFFPASLPNDGLFDLVCVDGTVSRWDALKILLAVEKGTHFELPLVSYRKILGYRIVPHKREGVAEEYISIDGEKVPFEPFQAEVHEGLGTVLAKRHLYDAPGV